MRKIKVLLDFIELAVAIKIAFFRNVITKLTGNASFPSPDIALAELETKVNDLETAFLDSRDGSHTAVSRMRDAVKAADTVFRILALYVDRVANGDETKILESGFNPSKQSTAPAKPELAVKDNGKSGSVKLVAKAVEKAGAYIWQMVKGGIPADESGWQTIGHTTAANFEKEDLEPAQKYWFRVSAITNKGVLDYTLPVMKLVV